ncbi:phospholipase DDHD1 [Cladorrhinum sp. PSN259]|nr:phospholipase DDHD1 [Cladorrhinum sp. PSN259]
MTTATPKPQHTFSPSCRLQPISSTPQNDDTPPPINAQFFYSSPIPIDDPLSAASTIITTSSTTPAESKLPVRPFTAGDNLALERAWRGFRNEEHRNGHAAAIKRQKRGDESAESVRAKFKGIVERLAKVHKERHEAEGAQGMAAGLTGQSVGMGVTSVKPEIQTCCPELRVEASAELRREFCAVTRRRVEGLDEDKVVEGVMALMVGSEGGKVGPLTTPMVIPGSVSRPGTLAGSPAVGTSMGRSDGLTGKPFAKIELDPLGTRSSRSSGVGTPEERGVGLRVGRARADSRGSTSGSGRKVSAMSLMQTPPPPPVEDVAEVMVGISRLHVVSLPVLQMKPIYWSPVNDIATVMRATWFYRDTMVPVEPLVANQLEAGYRELTPWTQMWRDQIKSALSVGPLGEEKISHRLWPDSTTDKRLKPVKDGLPPEPPISSDPFCAARCFEGEAATEGTLKPVHEETDTTMPPPEARTYARAEVIYKDATTAFLLKPSQTPSAYYSRRPLSKIMKGVTVGLPVVRGFDRATWERVHEKRAQSKEPTVEVQQSAGNADPRTCPGCEHDKEKGQVTDLVLIAHGIGQKIAERVESYHFTHVVNSFRRSVNVELQSPAVKAVLRPEQNGIMVLPINWRHLLSFEDGGPMSDEEDKAGDGFSLKDIEPNTIPAVRSMVSDVMFDVPFYMSHHKPKMIAALVGEANRVYRLWCKNNPGFADKGRVHLIGHSLGSAMAVDILSKQPTRVPRLNLAAPPSESHFEFDTINLFLLGSPAGFFMLLERGALCPRRGRMKADADPADTVAKDIVGEVGMFGCIAVDNIYNILAKEDPIAYLLNGTIDPVYAASLRQAYVPSISTSFFKTVSNTLSTLTGGGPSEPSATLTQPDHLSKPSIARLPSQLELEVHDFTREEIAEKKAFLLNDNGQVDYYLRSGGGPLEIQYLNMLSAHTSYWANMDLIRLICLEVGRRPGRRNGLACMRAVKVKGWKFGGDLGHGK